MAIRGPEIRLHACVLALCAGASMLGGCVATPLAKSTDEQRSADILSKLDDATVIATNAQRELALTADASVQREATARTRMLTDHADYDFYGPVEELVGGIASKYGYQFKVFGKRPPETLNVNVYVKKMQVVEVLRYVGTTASGWLDISVKPGVIELTYKNSNS